MRASPYIHMIGMVTCPRIHILATVVAVVVAAAVLGGSHHPWGGQFRLHARHPHILWHPTAHDVGPTALAHMIWMCWRWAPCSSGHFVSEQAASQKATFQGALASFGARVATNPLQPAPHYALAWTDR